jgi:hypothetical protein
MAKAQMISGNFPKSLARSHIDELLMSGEFCLYMGGCG